MFDPEDIIAMAQRQRKIQLLEQAQGGRRGGVTGEQLGAFIGGVLGYVVLIFVCGGIGGAIVFGLFASGLIDDGFESAEGCAIERNDREQIVEVSATNVELTDEALGRLCSMGLENVRKVGFKCVADPFLPTKDSCTSKEWTSWKTSTLVGTEVLPTLGWCT